MAKTRKEKEKILNECYQQLKASPNFVFINFFGLDSPSFFNLRNLLKEKGAKVKVIKKTLAKILMDKLRIPLNPREFEGSIALVWSEEQNFLSFLKEIEKFSKENENLKLIAGFFENKTLNQEELKELAKLPSKEELLSKVVFKMETPIFGLVFSLKSLHQKLVFLLANIKK